MCKSKNLLKVIAHPKTSTFTTVTRFYALIIKKFNFTVKSINFIADKKTKQLSQY